MEALLTQVETAYSDEELFALQALESVVVPSDLASANSETFNSAA